MAAAPSVIIDECVSIEMPIMHNTFFDSTTPLARSSSSLRRWLRLRHTIDAPNASLEGNGGE